VNTGKRTTCSATYLRQSCAICNTSGGQDQQTLYGESEFTAFENVKNLSDGAESADDLDLGQQAATGFSNPEQPSPRSGVTHAKPTVGSSLGQTN
jgi:hypothetical protein